MWCATRQTLAHLVAPTHRRPPAVGTARSRRMKHATTGTRRPTTAAKPIAWRWILDIRVTRRASLATSSWCAATASSVPQSSVTTAIRIRAMAARRTATSRLVTSVTASPARAPRPCAETASKRAQRAATTVTTSRTTAARLSAKQSPSVPRRAARRTAATA